MKKITVLLMGLVLMAGFVFAGGEGEGDMKDGAKGGGQKVIGYTFHAASDVFQNNLKNAFVAIAEDKGYKVTVIDPQSDINKQVNAVETFIAQGVDSIVISPLDFKGLAPVVKDAIAAGIPVVSLNSEVDVTGDGFSYVGSQNYDAGLIQAQYFIDKLPQGARVVYLEGTPGMEHSIARKAAVIENLIDKRGDLQLLASQTAEYDRTKGMSVTEDWIQAFPQIDVVIAANDQMALGAIEALKGAGRLEGVMVTGIDGTDGARSALKAGEMTMSVVQDGKGQATKGLEIAERMMNGEKVEQRYIVPFYPIDKNNPDD